MTTLDHYDFCKPYISDNEYILWEGAPEKGLTFTSRDLVMIPFSLFWLAFALFWEFSVITSTSSLFMAIWGLPFVGVGIYLLFGRFIQSICLRNKTFYIITNKKLIIRSGSKIKLYQAEDIPPMDIHLHKNGNGTILFWQESYRRMVEDTPPILRWKILQMLLVRRTRSAAWKSKWEKNYGRKCYNSPCCSRR